MHAGIMAERSDGPGYSREPEIGRDDEVPAIVAGTGRLL